MPRKSDAHHRQPETARNFHVDQRQRDGDALFAIEYIIEEAVARIVVFLLIAGEHLLLEQVRVQSLDIRKGRSASAEGYFGSHPVKTTKLGGHVEIRVLGACNHQRGLTDIDLVVLALEHARPLPDEVLGWHVNEGQGALQEAARRLHSGLPVPYSLTMLRIKNSRLAGRSASRRSSPQVDPSCLVRRGAVADTLTQVIERRREPVRVQPQDGAHRIV